MSPQRTEQLLDDLDAHIDATVAARDEVLAAIADRHVTPDEYQRILVAFAHERETAEVLPIHAEQIHAAVEMIAAIARPMALTPKVSRRLRELQEGVTRLEDARAARQWAYVNGPEAA